MEHSTENKSKYSLNENGEFVIDDYNLTKPFSSFFPGIAGVNGIPMWVFYVNRGQGICGMGIQDKDHSIMEFLPANRAYNLVSSQGFRTFLKVSQNSLSKYYEPFQNHYRDGKLSRTQRMIIAPSQLTFEEVNHSLNLTFKVEYFTVPQDRYAGLIRILSIHNTGSESIALEGLDGLPSIVPYGVDNFCLKNMRRTIEAFVEVCNFDNGVPFFKGKVEPADRPDVIKITRGNFYLGFEIDGQDANVLMPIVDPTRVFGPQLDFSFPKRFLEISSKEIGKNQILQNQLPCAMSLFETSIHPGEKYICSSIIGHASSLEELNGMATRIARKEYIEAKRNTNLEIIDSLTQCNLLCCNEPALDHYVRQNFLDNTIRGGFPFTLTGENTGTTLYLYSRKHGDMERDYNDFRIMPTKYSQGDGNFRDINQNRRSDLLFNPGIGDQNVEYFYNLIQLDGFNPLVLKETYFAIEDNDAINGILRKYIGDEHHPAVLAFLEERFTPGGLLTFFDEKNITLNVVADVFLGQILDHCHSIPATDYGESYWIDHWTYNLDLLENYLAVYPEKFLPLLLSKKTFTFYDNPYRVLPRDEKYVLWNGNAMQLGAVILDEEKKKLIESRSRDRNQVRVQYGEGYVYRTSLFNKVLCLIVNKLSSLDPEGVGVEMEAGKPGWYDALNGLPGLFGSSVCSTLEIKRHINFLLDALREYTAPNDEVLIFSELKEFMDNLQDILARRLLPFEFWEDASSAREYYREKTAYGVSGDEVPVAISRIMEFFEAALEKVNQGIEKARDEKSKTLFTYFRYEVPDYRRLEITGPEGEKKPKLNAGGLACIKPLKFKQYPLPLFLEGPVHFLRCRPGRNDAMEFVASVRKSELYDKSLKMYKVNTSLADQPMEIGRARVFSPGWLENESIWLHMEYKYMLELLRNELFSEFYDDFKNLCIPFLNPDVYGRSILENSSFLVSSAHPDPSIHGNGFVARLTGATAEFIHILLLMTVGPRPFRLNSRKELQLCLKPSLPGWLFTEKSRIIKIFKDNQWRDVEFPANTFSFMFLGKTLVTYHNPDGKDTFGKGGVKPAEWTITGINGDTQTLDVKTINGQLAVNIRRGKVDKIDIVLR